MAKVWQRRGNDSARKLAEFRARETRQALEARETAETLLEDRGAVNARAWVAHCATRDSNGFWRRVELELETLIARS